MKNRGFVHWVRFAKEGVEVDPGGAGTGFPSQGMLLISVITPKTIDSEAWAKPYYILGPHWTAQPKQKDFRVFFCEDKPGRRCEWLP
jgi:thiamine biosynthesis lipoprotein